MYQLGDKHEYKMRMYLMPDSMHVTLIQNKRDKVDLVTYLNNGSIFLKIGTRYMLFNESGNFIDEIEFKHQEQSKE